MILAPARHARAFRRGAAMMCGVAFIGGCGEARMVATGALDERTRTVIVGLMQDEQLVTGVSAAEESLELELPPSFLETAPVRVNRMQLAQTMAELGLNGPVLQGASAPSRPVSSLANLGTEIAELEPGQSAQFMEGPLDAPLASFRIVDPISCPQFEFEPVEVGAGYSHPSLELPDGRTVLPTVTGWFVLGGEPPAHFVSTGEARIYGASIDPDGDLWVQSHLDLARVDPDTGERKEVIAIVPELAIGGALLVTGRNPLRAFAFTPDAEIWKLDGETWTLHKALPAELVARPVLDRTTFRSRGGDAFIAAAHYFTALIEFDGEEYSYFQITTPTRGFPGIGKSRDGRLFFAESFSGTVFIESGSMWIQGPPAVTRILSFAPYGDGDVHMFGSNDGVIGLFDLERGVICGPMPLGAFTGVRDVVKVGERYFVTVMEAEAGTLCPDGSRQNERETHSHSMVAGGFEETS